MRKKIICALLICACICLFSFKEVCQGKEEWCYKKEMLKQTCAPVRHTDWDLSPFSSLLNI